jgi:hypothetical protein
LRAARHAARIAPHAPHDAAFDRQHRCVAERDHQAAGFDEPLNLCQTTPTDAACDVVRFRGRSMARRPRRLFERHRTPSLRYALDLLREFEIDMSVQQHIDLFP